MPHDSPDQHAHAPWIVLATAEGVEVRDGTRFDAVAFSAPLRNLVAVDVSPGGTFLVTFQRPSKESAGEKPARNLKVWRMPS